MRQDQQTPEEAVDAPGAGGGPTRWPAWAWVGALAIVAVYLLLGGLFPDADPTGWVPGGLDGRVSEFLVEGPAKAHEARNWALFGEFHRNPADNYQFWRAQAPLWVYPLALVFRVFGVSYPVLRFFTLFFGACGLVLTLVVLRRLVPPWAALGAAGLYATNVFATFLGRSGLIEVMLNACAVGLLASLLPARRHPGWLVLSQVVFTVGFFGKQGMVYLFPLLVVLNVWVFVGWVRDGRFPRARWLPVGSAALIAIVTLLVIVQPDYVRAVTWNTDHLILGRDGSHVAGDGWWKRLDGLRMWRTHLLMLPLLGGLSLTGAIWLGVRAWRARHLTWTDGVVLAWAASAWLAALGPHTFTLRQASIVLLPHVIVGAVVAARLQASSRASLLPLLGAATVFALVVNLAHQVRRYEDMSWDRQTLLRTVQARLGDGPAVIIGRHAMPMLLPTPYDLYYVKLGFNTQPDRLRALAPTHILLSDVDSTHKTLLAAEPDAALGSAIAHGRMNDYTMKLIPVKRPSTDEP